jgi:hypothetical protein
MMTAQKAGRRHRMVSAVGGWCDATQSPAAKAKSLIKSAAPDMAGGPRIRVLAVRLAWLGSGTCCNTMRRHLETVACVRSFS